MSKPTVSQLISLVTTCFMGLSILLLTASIVCALDNHSNPDEAFLLGMKPIYVSSNAMEPAIGQHSMVFTYQTALEDICLGDIVLRTVDDSIVLRRVVKTNAEGNLITLADNRPFEDATALDESTYIAKVLFR